MERKGWGGGRKVNSLGGAERKGGRNGQRGGERAGRDLSRIGVEISGKVTTLSLVSV